MSRRKRQALSKVEDDSDDCVSSSFMPGSTAGSSGNIGGSNLQKGSATGHQTVDSKVVDKRLAMFIISNTMAFNPIETPFFLDFVKGVAELGRDYKLPNSVSFNEVKEEVDKYVTNVKQLWTSNGCTIMLGEWKNFFNVVVYSPEGAVFLKLQRISKKQVSNDDVKGIVFSIIDEIGADHVVQITTNNDALHELSKDVSIPKYSHIYWIHCVAHEIHFLLKAIYDKVDWVREAIDRAARIVKFMYEDVIILSLVRQFTNSLKYACMSKFASNYQMLQSILSNKEELRQLIASEEWKKLKNKETKKMITSTIQDREFWNQVQEVLKVMEPLVEVLRLVEDDRATTGYLYEAMEKAREAIKRHKKYPMILNLFEEKSKKIIHPIHTAAAALNPVYMSRRNFRLNDEMERGIEFVFNTLVHGEENKKIKEEMNLYVTKKSDAFNAMGCEMLKVSHPRVWWEYAGVFLPVLRKLAMRILSQTCKCSCDLKPRAFEVAQIFPLYQKKVKGAALRISQEDFVYNAMNSKIMENFRSLGEHSSKGIDLENCNELPDYTDTHQDSWLA